MRPDRDQAASQIISAGKFLDSRGMAPATSGNYSMRLNDGCIAITVSGKHKGRLCDPDIMLVDTQGKPLEDKKPSDETLLHAQIYELFPDAGAILHVHSVAGTVLTRVYQSADITLAGYEMLKAFPGVKTHETVITIPVFSNSQDMKALSGDVAQGINKNIPAYIIRDHGFYVWGRDMAEAERIAEALEFILNCELEITKIKTGAKA
jgi:methylthioribulose-1-phosphate dehydratase